MFKESKKFGNLSATGDALKHLSLATSFGRGDVVDLNIRIPTISWHPWIATRCKSGYLMRVSRGPHYNAYDDFLSNVLEEKCPRLFVINGSVVCVYFAPYLVFDETTEYEMDYNNREIFIYEKSILFYAN
jgi:hypothetical protein